MIFRAEGLVKSLTKPTQGITQAIVEVAGKDYPAINFDTMTGSIVVNDRVLLNTTAVDLELGTGGSHFVMANLTAPVDREKAEPEPGHIMKLRYTPNQIKVLAAEEPDSPFHELMVSCTSLADTPVVCCSLHSMLPAVAAAVKAFNNDLKVVYVMTDGAALPLGFSKMAAVLKREGLIDGTVSVGHAFGGQVEAVNIYSGLLAAKAILNAEVIIVAMGPGIVGTGTPFGFSGMEQAGIIHAVHALEGRSIAVPRIGFADARERHKGLSHHSRTILGRAVLVESHVSLPIMKAPQHNMIVRQMQECGITAKHKIVLDKGEPGLDMLKLHNIRVTTMGRSVAEEPEFFLAASCAGRIAARMVAGEQLEYWEETK